MSTITLKLDYYDGRSEQRALAPGVYQIGRDSGQILLGDPNTSARHAELHIQPGSVMITDVGSTNGTYDVAGSRLTAPHQMRIGAPVRMGNTSITLVAADGAAGGTRVMSAQELAAGPAAAAAAQASGQGGFAQAAAGPQPGFPPSGAVPGIAPGGPPGFAPPEQPQGFAPPGQPPGFAPPGQPPGFAPPGQPQGFTPPGQPPGFAPPGQPGFAPPGQAPGFAAPGQPPGFAPQGQPGFAPPGQPPGFAPQGSDPSGPGAAMAAAPGQALVASDDKLVGILAYLTLVGFVVALIMHNSKKTELGAFHLRQALGYLLTSFVGGIVIGIGSTVIMLLASAVPFLALLSSLLWLVYGLGMLVLWVLGLLSAINGTMKPMPVVGALYQKWFATAFR